MALRPERRDQYRLQSEKARMLWQIRRARGPPRRSRLDPFAEQVLPAWFHLPPSYKGGRIPAVIAIPGMDSFKEVNVALYGDRWLNRGIAVLAIDGPGQYEAPILGTYFSVENWVAAAKPVFDWLAARAEIDADRIGVTGTSFGSFFGTVLAASEPRRP